VTQKKSIFKEIAEWLGITGMVVVAIVLLGFGSLAYYKYFVPKWADARREVFENTKSYNEGKTMDLARYRLEYLQEKDPDSKEALASTIRHMFADFDKEKLTPELRKFLQEVRGY